MIMFAHSFWDGFGSELISAILGLLVGGFGGYTIGVNKTKIKQQQKAGDNAIQSQIGNNGSK